MRGIFMRLIEKLKAENLVNKNGKVSPWCDRKISSSLREEVYQLSSFLQHDYNISDRIKILMLGYTDHPRCPCGSFVYYHRAKKDFVEYCSAPCASKHTNEKRLETVKNRYNTDNFFPTITKEQRSINSKKANRKAREQLKNKYNVSNPMYIPGIKHKHKQSITGKTKTYTSGNHYYFYNNLSEKENMILNGYRIYFDCGNAKYILRQSQIFVSYK